ncbi:MAG: glutathione peroxidase [Halioglobus sp.]
MMRTFLFLSGLAASSAAWSACPAYLDHDLRKLHSKDTVNLCEAYEGRPLLIVNTASHCGYTKQFGGLEALNKEYADRGLAVVGFASDDFRQEAKDEAKAADICFKNYGVTFTMIAPSSVKGDEANPVFTELNRQAGKPSWNFNKYLVDSEGNVVQHFGSNTSPDDAELVNAIEELL